MQRPRGRRKPGGRVWKNSEEAGVAGAEGVREEEGGGTRSWLCRLLFGLCLPSAEVGVAGGFGAEEGHDQIHILEESPQLPC